MTPAETENARIVALVMTSVCACCSITSTSTAKRDISAEERRFARNMPLSRRHDRAVVGNKRLKTARSANGGQPTAMVRRRMVRRGSTVRVRQRLRFASCLDDAFVFGVTRMALAMSTETPRVDSGALSRSRSLARSSRSQPSQASAQRSSMASLCASRRSFELCGALLDGRYGEGLRKAWARLGSLIERSKVLSMWRRSRRGISALIRGG